MKYFLDTEFIEYPRTIELISIGIVAEDGREYYAVHTECDCSKASDWVVKNVLEKMPEWNGAYNDLRKAGGAYGKKTTKDIANEILAFCGYHNNAPEKPEFWGYYADYDWVNFCWLFGTMMSLPSGWPMYCKDVKQLCDSLGNPKLPEMQSIAHNALDDAKWTKVCHDSLMSFWAKDAK